MLFSAKRILPEVLSALQPDRDVTRDHSRLLRARRRGSSAIARIVGSFMVVV
jgi:hypothetical protein